MVAISILAIVTGLLYSSYQEGWFLFKKSFQFGRVQADARSALEEMCQRLKRANKDLVYISESYNLQVPLPEDAIFSKPYIYFAVAEPQSADAKPQANRDGKVSNHITRDIAYPPYTYYLYYIAKARDKDGEFSASKAHLKLFVIKNQDGEYTISNKTQWPFLPPSLIGKTDYLEDPSTYRRGFAGNVDHQLLSPEFSLYQSKFAYNYYNSNYESLFKVQVRMVDSESKTKMDFETAINPRN